MESKKIGPVGDLSYCRVYLCQMFSFWICHEPTEESLHSVHIDFLTNQRGGSQWWLTVIWRMKSSFFSQQCAAATQMNFLTIRDLIADNSCRNLTGVQLGFLSRATHQQGAKGWGTRGGNVTISKGHGVHIDQLQSDSSCMHSFVIRPHTDVYRLLQPQLMEITICAPQQQMDFRSSLVVLM